MQLKCDAMNRVRDMYLRDKMSTREISNASISAVGFKISPYQVYSLLKRDGVRFRTLSESVSMAMSTLDCEASFMDDKTLEWVDGFLLGDGSIDRRRKTVIGNKFGSRFRIGSSQPEWAKYAMSGLFAYRPSEPKESNRTTHTKSPNPTWASSTLTHPDIVQQMNRWYPDDRKTVPDDVRITPISVLLWYLGDGSICSNDDSNYSAVRLATCSFLPEKIESILMVKLTSVGIECVREKSKNDIRIRTSSIGAFFDFIGRSSPIQCYAHKFVVPSWLYLNRLEDIAKTPQERWRAIYHVRTGKVKCSSSPGGKMFLFDDEQAAKLRILLDSTGR